MARASAYDEFDDGGMAFSSEELWEYKPEQWAQERVALLCAMRQVVMRRIELPDVPKPIWWKEAAKLLENKIDWYCRAVPLVGATPEEKGSEGLPGRTSAKGKELSKAASLLDEHDWVGRWHEDASTALRYVVTIGRRAAAQCKWSKETMKASNRLANCVTQEVDACERLEKILASYHT